MTANNRVVVIEDDPLSRDMLLNLLSRDWRTRVAAELDSLSENRLIKLLNEESSQIDTVIVDTEMPRWPDFPIRVFEIITELENPPKTLFLCTVPKPRFWNDVLINYDFFGGYLAKHEILYSIATAVSLVEDGYIVVTSAVDQMSAPIHLSGKKVLLLDGTKNLIGFTPREIDIIRLGILSNHSHRDIEDELIISRDWISKNLSAIYRKLGIQELISDQESIDLHFSHKAIATRVDKILKHFSPSSNPTNLRQTPWLATLAFHLLTLPDIRDV